MSIIKKFIKINAIYLIIFFLSAQTVYTALKLMPRNDIPGLTNFAQVSKCLYRGAQPDKKGFEELSKMGIKTIINLRANHSDIKMLKGLNLKYINIPINTWDLTDEHAVKFLKIINNSDYQPVFVHCQHGSDRTGSMVAIYRMFIEGWTHEEALKELPDFGYHKIWKNLVKYLKNLDLNKLRKKLKTAEEPELKVIN
ncbi:dual specificity protein phosphatase family protein [Candidatus Desantisbacteria bacterium]|nr:dual specificity protein phosphatase family protein [Candidatus Desantisbacteria bacterium]